MHDGLMDMNVTSRTRQSAYGCREKFTGDGEFCFLGSFSFRVCFLLREILCFLERNFGCILFLSCIPIVYVLYSFLKRCGILSVPKGKRNWIVVNVFSEKVSDIYFNVAFYFVLPKLRCVAWIMKVCLKFILLGIRNIVYYFCIAMHRTGNAVGFTLLDKSVTLIYMGKNLK